ncbi:ATP-binding protein [Streptomyces sp. NPDC047028]|uniref:sensor histidine kinase n=1 Tax=Streptomyces sp. NPDC047028 TaxID=3155793 RepID=UPI0033D06F2C
MTSERARLTALYGGLLILAGALLTGGVYLLVRQALHGSITRAVTAVVPVGTAAGAQLDLRPPYRLADASGPLPSPGVARRVSDATEHAVLGNLLTVSGVGLGLFALVSVALAWWMAGRVLRPVAVITATARRLSGENLHERIALKAPPGELKQLADTFDEMLGRIEQLVSAQQRFAASAAHELRTPLAVQRAAAEIGLAGEPPPEKVVRIRRKLMEVADESEQLIEGLLLLTVSEQGLRHRERTDLDTVTSAVVDGLAAEAAGRGVAVDIRAEPLEVCGDGVLLDHLVHNLVGNAIRYNRPGGNVTVRVGPEPGPATLEVVNTGPVVSPDTVHHLFEPFRRAEARRHAPGEGAGLGLSIVASIARAHDAEVAATANPSGGLTVRVIFPPT